VDGDESFLSDAWARLELLWTTNDACLVHVYYRSTKAWIGGSKCSCLLLHDFVL
jgi:hypothetical protein